LFFLSLLLSNFIARSQNYLQGTPRLYNNNGHTTLLVDKQPFLILGGELGNPSASDAKYMVSVWPKLKKMHLNTLVAPVYWELMELQEGKFNFTLLDDLIENARKNNIKLVLLWFGTWKNSMSCYVPSWIKTDVARFPRDPGRRSAGNYHSVFCERFGCR
jgi:beta-galactosidase GanA